VAAAIADGARVGACQERDIYNAFCDVGGDHMDEAKKFLEVFGPFAGLGRALSHTVQRAKMCCWSCDGAMQPKRMPLNERISPSKNPS